MKKDSNKELPSFVKPVRKGKFIVIILVLLVVSGALGFLYVQARNENSDLNRQVKNLQTTTTAKKSATPTTSTTIPESQLAKVDILANDNNSEKTTTRIQQDFDGKVNITKVPTTSPIDATVVVVNNPEFEELAQQIVDALGGTIGIVPEGQPASVADIVIYVKS